MRPTSHPLRAIVAPALATVTARAVDFDIIKFGATSGATFKYLAEGKGAAATARLGKGGITIRDPNRASEDVDKMFQRANERAIRVPLEQSTEYPS